MFNIEVFDRQIDDIKVSLDELKKETSIEQKNKKTKSTKEKINKTKQEINKRLDELKNIGDDTSLEEAKKLEEKLAILENISGEILTLENEVKSGDSYEDHRKGWFRRQREGVTSKEGRKENTWTNVRRVAMGIGAVSAAWRGIKKLFGIGKKNKKTKESDDGEKSEKRLRWKRALLWGLGIFGGVLVWKNQDWIKDKLGLSNKLSFEDSLVQVEAELGTISESDDINRGRGKITYDESVKQIKSYGLSTQIDRITRKVDGLDIKFSDYKQLIHASNIINYIKHKYKGRCEGDTPFYTKSITGDIYINIKDGNNDVKEEEIISGGLFSTLSSICPDVLNGILKNTSNKDKFLAFLNKQGIWKEGNVEPPNPNGDKVQEKMNEVWTEIIATPTEFDPLGNERGKILTVPGNADKTQYTIQSRGNPPQQTNIKLEVDSSANIKLGKIDDLEINFTDLKELLRTANLINKLKYQYSVAIPLKLGPNEKAFYWTNSFGIVGGHPGLYVDNSTTWTLDDRVVKKDTLEDKFPILYASKDIFIDYMNSLKDPSGKGLREK